MSLVTNITIHHFFVCLCSYYCVVAVLLIHSSSLIRRSVFRPAPQSIKVLKCTEEYLSVELQVSNRWDPDSICRTSPLIVLMRQTADCQSGPSTSLAVDQPERCALTVHMVTDLLSCSPQRHI